MAFGGGPAGGTFQYFANAMALYIQGHVGGLNLTSEASGGSLENLKHLNTGEIDYAVVYMGDASLGRKGALIGDPTKYENIRPWPFLYGAPAQLVVRADSGITDVQGLAGKRVAVGNAGSGAAIACERYHRPARPVGQDRQAVPGLRPGRRGFAQGQDRRLLAPRGLPQRDHRRGRGRDPVRLLDLGAPRPGLGLTTRPSLSTPPPTIPAGPTPDRRPGIELPGRGPYWMASKEVSPEIVYASVAAVFSPTAWPPWSRPTRPPAK
jgi:hypothetical protein